MGQENLRKEQKLFMYMVGTFKSSAWIALGKMKNPVTDKTEVDLRSASIQIDMLEMINNRMSASLDENETKYLDQVLSELKMNFVDEQNKEKNSDDNSKDKK